MKKCRLLSKHRSHVAWRPTLPGAPARSTGGDRPRVTEMKRVAAARTTGCYRNLYQTPLSTPAAAAPTPTSIGTIGGRLDRARDEEKARATAPATQRMYGGAHKHALISVGREYSRRRCSRATGLVSTIYSMPRSGLRAFFRLGPWIADVRGG
jgi:hypothetical protein